MSIEIIFRFSEILKREKNMTWAGWRDPGTAGEGSVQFLNHDWFPYRFLQFGGPNRSPQLEGEVLVIP